MFLREQIKQQELAILEQMKLQELLILEVLTKESTIKALQQSFL
jgi:hypothetical protein